MNLAKTVKPNQGNLRIIIVAQLCINAILLLLIFEYELSDLPPNSFIYPLCCLLCILTVWSFWSWYVLTNSLFNPYLLFFLSIFLFNGGQAMLEVFHLNEGGILAPLKFSPITLLYTLFLVSLSLGSFHLGALISVANEQLNQLSKYKPIKEEFFAINRACYLVGLALFSIAFLPTIFFFRNTASIVYDSGYAGIYQQDYATNISSTGSEILSGFMIPASMFLLAGSKEKTKGRLMSVIIIGIYIVIKFFLGQRNQGIMPLISFAWLWNQFISPIPKILLLSIGTLMLSVILPLIAITRDITGKDRLSIDLILESYTSIDNPVIASISEMGSSMLTVAYTIELVPKVREFQMGAEYFYALLVLVPNFFGGKLHPSIARGFPDAWLVNEVNPDWALSGGSYGFSCIAEAYLNFGWFGTLITLGVIGFLLAKFTLWAIRSGNPAKMAMLASFISSFLFYARAESVFMTRPLVWYSLIPYLCVCILSRKLSVKITK